ncbi:MAG: sporulation protein YabP [Clostridia bacterium]|nr:sporulation protein YabP [Clostridia bacterium]
MDENRLQLENRKILRITGVTDVSSFSDDQAEIETSLGLLQIGGRALHLDLLDLEKREAQLSGQIDSLWYPDKGGERKEGFFSRLFSS